MIRKSYKRARPYIDQSPVFFSFLLSCLHLILAQSASIPTPTLEEVREEEREREVEVGGRKKKAVVTTDINASFFKRHSRISNYAPLSGQFTLQQKGIVSFLQ